ncbi:MAG: hypothetical protein IKK33_09040 [Lachnospiraceae bacterium]|nr:hypothetical protein [Lachnospiraceae bacterium]
MEKKEFLKSIKACGKKLNRAEVAKNLVFSLSVGAGVGILFQIIAFCMPFYRANICSMLAVVIAILTALIISVLRRKTLYQAALYMDSFGFQERIVTAYEHLDEVGEMVELQRKDAMKQLRDHKERIRVPLLKGWKAPAIMCLLLVTMVVLMFLPTEMKKMAEELHMVREEAEEKEEELKEVLESMESLQQESLTPEQLATLQEMMESLQASMQEYHNAESKEMMETANQKLDYKYDNMSQQLMDMADIMQSGANISPQSIDAMQQMAEKIQELGESGMQKGATSLVDNQGTEGEQSGDGQNNNEAGNQQNQGQNPGQNGQTGNQQSNGQNGQNSNGQSQGQSQGNGQGQGTGQGNSQGQGDGSGQGEGSGSGRGEGSGASPHDYVSIPNEIMDTGNLSGNASSHEDSDYFRTQNGLSWEGNHVSHEAVIGSYEENAYEGIAAGRYPSGMEDVIKDYFASFN